jgi:hypothetical protein
VKVRVRVIRGADRGVEREVGAGERLFIGREAVDGLLLSDPSVGRNHVVIEVAADRAQVHDLRSRHGTRLNGEPVAAAELRDGDELQLGASALRVHIEGQPTVRGWSTTGAAPAGMAFVTCRCGRRAPDQPAARVDDEVAYLCDECHEDLLAHPRFPDGYQLVRVLGRGAMGCVYEVSHPELDAHRAIKQILPRAAMAKGARALFEREARVQAAIDHPNVVQLIDLRQPAPAEFFMVMELVAGESADRWLAAGPLAPELAVDIACQALAGLDHAHRLGIVHRDLKEANLLVSRQAHGGVHVKVADFGLAKNFHEAGASGLTADGTFGGTLAYMPLEQLKDFRYVKPSADIYAMGTTLYRLLTGTYPRDFAVDRHPVIAVMDAVVTPLARRAPHLPAALAAAVDRALEADPARRHGSAAAMRASLCAAMGW